MTFEIFTFEVLDPPAMLMLHETACTAWLELDPQPAIPPVLRRHLPCPCGSGKIYRDCCYLNGGRSE